MAITATTQFANPDPGIKFTTQQDEIDLLNSLVTTTIDTDVNTFVYGSTTPAVEDQDKPWFRLNASGTPDSIYIYANGFWVKMPPSPGAEWGLYFGNPVVDFDGDGRGLKGVGPVAKTYYGWQLMNGKNGVANWSDRFIIGGRMDNVGITGYSGAWRTNVTGSPLVVGGVTEITLDENTTYQPAENAILSAKYSADGNAQGGSLWGDTNGSSDFDVKAAVAGNTTPDSISVVNPFYAAAYIQFVGYDIPGY